MQRECVWGYGVFRGSVTWLMLVDLTMTLREGMASHPLHGRTPLFLSGTLAHERLYPGMDRKNPYDGSPISFANANVTCATTRERIWTRPSTATRTA